MKRMLLASVLAAGLVTTTWTGSAHYQAGICIDAEPVVIGADPAQVAYVIDGNGGLWVFIEGNSHAQLQAGGLHPVLGDLDAFPCYSHPCTGSFVDPGGTKACPTGQRRLAPDILIL